MAEAGNEGHGAGQNGSENDCPYPAARHISLTDVLVQGAWMQQAAGNVTWHEL